MKLKKRKKVIEQKIAEPHIYIVMPAGVGPQATESLSTALRQLGLFNQCKFFQLSPNSKYKKQDIAPYRDKILELAMTNDCKVLCTVGPDVFKHLLGRGKKPSMQTLQGSPVFERLINYKVVVPLPEIAQFDLPFPEEEPKFAQRRFMEWIQNCAATLNNCLKVVENVYYE